MEKGIPYRILIVLTLTLAVLFAAIHAAQAHSANQSATKAQGIESVQAPEGVNPDPNCRYGVAAYGNAQMPYLDVLGAGWYVNFVASSPPAGNGAEFYHVIRVKQDKSGATYLPGYTISPDFPGLANLIDSNPGEIWIVGNEVDRGPDLPGDPNRVQDDTHPDVYAEAYHDVYHFIKQRDPSALVANSALVQVTPGRIQYLDLMYDAYVDKYSSHMPVDIWNMHVYILPEVHPDGEPNGIANVALGTDPALGVSESFDPDGSGPLTSADTCDNPAVYGNVYCLAEHDDMDIFAQHVRRMRQWMHDRGYRNSPLVLSEYSLLYPYAYPNGDPLWDEYGERFSPARVEAFMSDSLQYLSTATDPVLGYPADNNRLVQQWLWFSVYVEVEGKVSNLIESEETGTLTNLGQTYRTSAAAENYVNLYPQEVNMPSASTNISGTASVTLTAEIGNNGTRTAGAFDVSFYSNAGLSNLIGRVTVPAQSSNFPGMTGCSTRTVEVSVPWDGLGPGRHYYWVKVNDGPTTVPEVLPNAQDGAADNVKRGTVFIDAEQIYLPIIVKG